MVNYLYLFFGLFIPGSSFLATHKKWLCFTSTLFGIVWVLFFCSTRLVIEKPYFLVMLFGLISVHILTLFFAIFMPKPKSIKSTSTFLFFLTNTTLFVAITLLSHAHKHNWFGFAFYQIPSESMMPTLLVGDVILVDTWIYQHQMIQTQDIVVFKRNEKGMVLIKRVSNRRKNNSNDEMFVEGDNKNRSIDSRRFGWVTTDYIIGQYSFVWFNLNPYQK